MSVQRRVPSPSSQLLADEAGSSEQYDLAEALQWTKEDLEANLYTDKNRSLLLDEMLGDLEALESLSDVEIDEIAFESGDILNQPVWMDSKLYPVDVQTQYSQLTNISQLPAATISYDVVNNGAFTPPQTPPYEHQQQYQAVGCELPIINSNNSIINQEVVQEDYSENDLVIPLELPVYTTSQTDVARELAVVDELVRCRANSFASSSPSPSSPSWASTSSVSCMSSSNSSCGGESSLEDFEWSSESNSNSKLKAKSQRGRKRSRPYNTDEHLDKKSRKKEQNKNAATRYRMKKKAEVAEILSEENDLEQTKITHEAKIVDLEREIKLMKGLMSEFFRKQGLIK